MLNWCVKCSWKQPKIFDSFDLEKFEVCEKWYPKYSSNKNTYLSHRIIDSFPWILKWIIVWLKPKARANKTVINFMILILIFVENCLYYDDFQYDWEPVLIQQILIGERLIHLRLSLTVSTVLLTNKHYFICGKNLLHGGLKLYPFDFMAVWW